MQRRQVAITASNDWNQSGCDKPLQELVTPVVMNHSLGDDRASEAMRSAARTGRGRREGVDRHCRFVLSWVSEG